MTSRRRKLLIGLGIGFVAGLFVLGFFVGVAVYGWRDAVRAGNEAAPIQNLKAIAAVEIQYFNTHKKSFGTFDDLLKEQMLSNRFEGNPVLIDGYIFDLRLSSGSQSSYTINADPQTNSPFGRHFYLDSTSESIHVNTEDRATARDPIL